MGRKVYITYHPTADPDADVAIAWREGGQDVYWPVQLKDLVPAPGEDPKDALATLLSDVASTYPTSPDLLVAIRVTCPWAVTSLPKAPPMNVGEVWMYGPVSNAEWNVVGDLRLQMPVEKRFTLPQSTCEDAGLPTSP